MLLLMRQKIFMFFGQHISTMFIPIHPWIYGAGGRIIKNIISNTCFSCLAYLKCGWMDFRAISNANLYFLIHSTFIYDIFHILRHRNLLYPFWIIIEFNVRCGFFGTSPNNFHFLMCRWKSTDTWLLFVLTCFGGLLCCWWLFGIVSVVCCTFVVGFWEFFFAISYE